MRQSKRNHKQATNRVGTVGAGRWMLRIGTTAAAMALVVTGYVAAQPSKIPTRIVDVQIDSGIRANHGVQPQTVFAEVINLGPTVPWARVLFDRGDTRLARGSFIRITSLHDGQSHSLSARDLENWGYGTAFFNGSLYWVELVAGPETVGNSLQIRRVVVGERAGQIQGGQAGRGGDDVAFAICGVCTQPPANEGNPCVSNDQCDTSPGSGDGVCGHTDSRTEADHPAIGRLLNVTSFPRFCAGGANDGELCDDDADCPGGSCYVPESLANGRCTGGPNDDGLCNTDFDCLFGGICTLFVGRCSGGDSHAHECRDDDDCPGTDGLCIEVGECFSGANKGNGCDEDADCPDGFCMMANANIGFCTAFIEDSNPSNDKIHVTAGHCFGGNHNQNYAGISILQFDVPLSLNNCSVQHPPVNRQFPVRGDSVISKDGDLGNDWAVFKCHRNNENLTTYERQGSALTLRDDLTPDAGEGVRVTGYGHDGSHIPGAPAGNQSCTECPVPGGMCDGGTNDGNLCVEDTDCPGGACEEFAGTHNFYLQTAVGPFVSAVGNVLNYRADDCGGNSGSPLIFPIGSNNAIGIQTHGGCELASVLHNSGTWAGHTDLQNAIDTLQGIKGCCWRRVGAGIECQQVVEADCDTQQFTFVQGAECGSAACGGEWACCLPNGQCDTRSQQSCQDSGGTFYANEQCSVPRACCFPNGSCQNLDPLCCLEQGGLPQSPGSTCAQVQCAPEPTRACCLNGTCELRTVANCQAVGGIPQGPGVTCLPLNPCPNACCSGVTGNCTMVSEAECNAVPGVFLEGFDCNAAPPMACCDPNSDCVNLQWFCCDLMGRQAIPGQFCGGPAGCCNNAGACVNGVDRICCAFQLGRAPLIGACAGNNVACCEGQMCNNMDSACCNARGGIAGPLPCAGAPAACCLGGTCEVLDPECCAVRGGIAFPGQVCGPGQPEACCLEGGNCAMAHPFCCENELNGDRQAGVFNCQPNPCENACCLKDGSCQMLSQADCEGQGGTFHEGAQCTQEWACCDEDGVCEMFDPVCCPDGSQSVEGQLCTQEEACCDEDGSCEMLDPACCDGQPTIGAECSEEPEACCLESGKCEMYDPACCEKFGGEPQGKGSECEPNPCENACCRPEGDKGDLICEMLPEEECLELEGTYHKGEECTKEHACCLEDNTCEMLDPVCCEELGGTLFEGKECTEEHACCLDDGTCVMLDPVCCEHAGGTPYEGEECTELEACCFADGTCQMLDPVCCADKGGKPKGKGTNCDQPDICERSCEAIAEKLELSQDDLSAVASLMDELIVLINDPNADPEEIEQKENEAVGHLQSALGILHKMKALITAIIAEGGADDCPPVKELESILKTLNGLNEIVGGAIDQLQEVIDDEEITPAQKKEAYGQIKDAVTEASDGITPVIGDLTPRVGCCWRCEGARTICQNNVPQHQCEYNFVEDNQCGTNECGEGKCEKPSPSGCCWWRTDGTDFCEDDVSKDECDFNFVADKTCADPECIQGPCEPRWSAIGLFGMNNRVRTMAVFDDGSGGGPAIYVGGDFTMVDGMPINYIARWDGAAWTPVGGGMNSWVDALIVFDDGFGGGPALYASGQFTVAGGVPANRVAKWDGSAWSPLGIGMNQRVFDLAVYDDGIGDGAALYAGGTFTTAGGQTVNRIARWNGSAWSSLSTGIGGGSSPVVFALTVFDDGMGGGPALYAGGNFTNAGGMNASHIARWNGQSWSPVGNGMNGEVYAMKEFDDGMGGNSLLYAGGQFTVAGGVTAPHIAKWNGSMWSSVGGGMNSQVWVLEASDVAVGTGDGSVLYAGGPFTLAGDVNANRIAKWDGFQWSALGSGMNNAVQALAVFDDSHDGIPSLFAGGLFTVAGGLSAIRIAKWQGCPTEPKPECKIPGDINCDGVVDTDDLFLLLASWGECPDPDDCPADLDENGVVDVEDLFILLANWG